MSINHIQGHWQNRPREMWQPDLRAEEIKNRLWNINREFVGAILREPGTFSTFAPMLREWVLDLQTDSVVSAVFKIYRKHGSFNLSQISIESKISIDELHSHISNSSYALSEIYEIWSREYRLFVEMQVAAKQMFLAQTGEDPETITVEIQKLRQELTVINSETPEDPFLELEKKIQAKIEGKSILHPTTPRLRALQKAIPDYHPGDLIIVAGRPAMGKTQFALGEIWAALERGQTVLLFTLEMTAAQLLERMAEMLSGWSLKKTYGKDELLEISAKAEMFKGYNLKIYDRYTNLAAIEQTAFSRKAVGKVDMIVLDYMQLIDISGRFENDTSRMTEISKRLKRLAKSIGCPLIAVSQLSRAVETRGGSKRPQLSDLRQSGAIEQDADIIIFPYRAEYYKITEMEDENGNTVSTEGKAEIIIAKSRNHGIPSSFCVCCFDQNAPWKGFFNDDSDLPTFKRLPPQTEIHKQLPPERTDLENIPQASLQLENPNIITKSVRMTEDQIPF